MRLYALLKSGPFTVSSPCPDVVGSGDVFLRYAGKVFSDGLVVTGDKLEGFARQGEPRREAQRAAGLAHFFHDSRVVSRIGERRYPVEVLCRSPHHARAADVDVAPGIFERRAALRDCLLKRVE